jgi:cytochrome c oxidase subunit 2
MSTRRVRVALVVAVALGLAACGDGSPSMFDSQGPESRSIRGVSVLMFVLAGAVYVIVSAFIVVAIVRGRRRAEQAEPAKEPKDDTFIWWGGIVAPVVILAVLAVVTIRTTQDLRAGVVTASEIHIPVGRPVDIVLTSDNVIHSFWVPQLAGKVDTIPGQVNHLRLRADEAGTYRGMCAEYCGIQHANMSYSVIAEEPAEFERWMARRSAGAGLTPASEQAARGQVVFNREACAGCHAVRGTQATATIGPDLSDFGARTTIGSLTVPNNSSNLARWITEPEKVKPGNLMPPTALSPDDLAAVIAYLEGLK